MKRRTFIKGLLGASAVVATPSLAEKFAESMAETRKTIAINVPPRIGDLMTLSSKGVPVVYEQGSKVIGVWDGERIIGYDFFPPNYPIL